MNKHFSFILFVFGLIFISLVIEKFLINENHYYEYYASQLSLNQIDSLINNQSKWSWVGYLLLPVIYLLKFSMLSIWILVGIIFFSYKTSFKKIFHLVIVSEFVFLIPAFIKVVWFGLIHTDFTLEELSYFTPLSVANLFDLQQLDPWWVYPLQSINLFELIYILVLAFGIRNLIKLDYSEALKFTIPVYGSGLIIWIVFVSFLTLNYSV
ncbi:MAG: hypothetical protein CMP48_24205 [Rickettsiales bacterium]|nr:hypothetical protein [Rickettsiales bacterium]